MAVAGEAGVTEPLCQFLDFVCCYPAPYDSWDMVQPPPARTEGGRMDGSQLRKTSSSLGPSSRC